MAEIQARLQALSEEFSKLQQGVMSPAPLNPNLLTYQRSPRCSAVKTKARGTEAREPRGAEGMFV